MTYDELRQLPVLDSVIRETLRIHPPIHSIMRKVRNDVVVPATISAPCEEITYVVPAGHYVFACPVASQMDPLIWKNPSMWNPTRWSDPDGVAAQAYKSYTDVGGEKIDYGFGAVSKGTESPYQPFGAGRHRCIGEQVRPIPIFARDNIIDPDCTLVRVSTIRYRSFDLGSPTPISLRIRAGPSQQLSCNSLSCVARLEYIANIVFRRLLPRRKSHVTLYIAAGRSCNSATLVLPT